MAFYRVASKGLVFRAGRWLFFGLLSAVFISAAGAQTAFAVASIRPSGESVKFEHDGKTETSPGNLRMKDVTLRTCIKWAYGVQESQISGPDWMESEHFDILAKADQPVGDEQMKLMMQALLAERFKLGFHHEQKELKSFALTVAKGGPKLHEAADGSTSSRQNSANGMMARSYTMGEFASFLSGPLQAPVVDMTGLKSKYDFDLDFTPYLPADERTERPDSAYILNATLQAEVGLKIQPHKETVEIMVIDHVERPTAN
jgi:uncharacterized protein (TIGR03435 family)